MCRNIRQETMPCKYLPQHRRVPNMRSLSLQLLLRVWPGLLRLILLRQPPTLRGKHLLGRLLLRQERYLCRQAGHRQSALRLKAHARHTTCPSAISRLCWPRWRHRASSAKVLRCHSALTASLHLGSVPYEHHGPSIIAPVGQCWCWALRRQSQVLQCLSRHVHVQGGIQQTIEFMLELADD